MNSIQKIKNLIAHYERAPIRQQESRDYVLAMKSILNLLEEEEKEDKTKPNPLWQDKTTQPPTPSAIPIIDRAVEQAICGGIVSRDVLIDTLMAIKAAVLQDRDRNFLSKEEFKAESALSLEKITVELSKAIMMAKERWLEANLTAIFGDSFVRAARFNPQRAREILKFSDVRLVENLSSGALELWMGTRKMACFKWSPRLDGCLDFVRLFPELTVDKKPVINPEWHTATHELDLLHEFDCLPNELTADKKPAT